MSKNKSVKKSINKEGNKIIEKKEYQISTNNSNYSLKIEIDNHYIQFSVYELNIILNYVYRNKYELSKIVDQLNLVQSKYTSLSKLLKFIDKAYSKNKISIEPKSENELLLIFEVPVDFEEETFSLKLKKKTLDDKELLAILLEQINRLNNNNTIVKNKFKEIEKQINNISRKNSANRGSEGGSDINEEINIIKQQLNDINMKLSGTNVIGDNLKSRNNNNNNNHEQFFRIKSSISKITDNYYNNTYKSKKEKKNDNFEEKEDDNFYYDNKKTKTININERYNNNEEGYEDNKHEIYLKNNKTTLNKKKSKERNKNGSHDEYRDNKDTKIHLRKSNRDFRDNKNNRDNRDNRDINELKKSKKYYIKDDIKEEEKYDNNITPINKNKQKIKITTNEPQKNEKYFIIRNSLNDKDNDKDRDYYTNTNNDTLNNNINNNSNYEKKYIINNVSSNNINNNQEDEKLNQKQNKINDNISNNKQEKKRNSKIINLNNNNNDKNIENGITQSNNGNNRITYVEKNKKEMEDYSKKKNYIYNSSPIEFKYKIDICNTNTSCGWNDMFEVYVSYQNNKEYLASPDNNNFNINIISLTNNKLVTSLEGHKNRIRTIRYFIKEYNNDKNENNDKESKIIYEYLISADDNHIVIVWDILNNFEIKQKIDTNYEDDIYSCLIFFSEDNNINRNYIITSTYSTSNDIQNSATKIYSLENGEYAFYIKESNFDNIYYLLLWYNGVNNNNYLIQFSYKKILINSLEPKDNKLYAKLIHEPENEHYSGFIYSKNDSNLLCTSCYNGFIHIWDLYSKKIIDIIETNFILCHIIQWNEKYAIAANFNNKSFIIVDLDKKKIYNEDNTQHTMEVKCIKKVLHPKFGECLLSAGRDNFIKLWKL